ncbi:polymorphic toxin-type HINT domain-containing protein [Cerasicoccus maritimus]|uniref:polymorphic toxin-type HINT domain-containing protein n=1 Tax=Cerasicoccus maritimus TaxID=490089 RepID=UPI0028529251|nr:polymorphic toxin-type HINT domain-containing protein [Cerasicoccus maritimus]
MSVVRAARQADSIPQKARILTKGGIGADMRRTLMENGFVCFVAGTLVMTDQGALPIESIEPGMYVLSRYDNETGELVWAPVVERYEHETEQLCTLTLESWDGLQSTVTTTAEHPFFVDDFGWTDAALIPFGSELRLEDGSTATLVERQLSAAPEGASIPVYNLEVAETHTYFVCLPEGDELLWVHNQCAGADASKQGGNSQLTNDAIAYLHDIEAQTGLRVHAKQRAILANDLRQNSYSRLSKEAGETHRLEFSRTKNKLIKEWEAETGQVWPTYADDLFNDEGKLLRKAGDYYDGHHIIENVYGGPHTWWNIHPARFPDQHQGGLHRSLKKGGVVRRIFKK